jgi:hypothetical protein
MIHKLEPAPLVPMKDGEPLSPGHFVAVRTDGLDYLTCLETVASTPALIVELDRLHNTNLRRKRHPLDNAIDDATGKSKADLEVFMRFVWNCVFLTCQPINQN